MEPQCYYLYGFKKDMKRRGKNENANCTKTHEAENGCRPEILEVNLTKMLLINLITNFVQTKSQARRYARAKKKRRVAQQPVTSSSARTRNKKYCTASRPRTTRCTLRLLTIGKAEQRGLCLV